MLGKGGSFRTAYVGKDFTDAKNKRNIPDIGDSMLEKITQRKDNSITAKEHAKALKSSDIDIRKYAQKLKKNTFLLGICNEKCKRSGNEGHGNLTNGDGWKADCYTRQKGNQYRCIETTCPTPVSSSSNNNDIELGDKSFFFKDEILVQIDENSSVRTTIKEMYSKMVAPSNVNDIQRGTDIEKCAHWGQVNKNNLSIERLECYETKRKKKVGNYTVAIKPFSSSKKIPKYFVLKNGWNYISRDKRDGRFNEVRVGDWSAPQLHLDERQSVLMWIPTMVNFVPKIITDYFNEMKKFWDDYGIIMDIISEPGIYKKYNGFFLYFDDSIVLDGTYDYYGDVPISKLFEKLEDEGIIDGRCRPLIQLNPNWLTLFWKKDNIAGITQNYDDGEDPDLMSLDGHIDLEIHCERRKLKDIDSELDIVIEGIEAGNGRIILDEFGRARVSLFFSRKGNYRITLQSEKSRRIVNVRVEDVKPGNTKTKIEIFEKGSFIEIGNTGKQFESEFRNSKIRREILQNALDSPKYQDYNIDINHWMREGYSLEHVLLEITRLTYHHHTPTWSRNRSNLYSLLADEFSSNNTKIDEMSISEYVRRYLSEFYQELSDQSFVERKWIKLEPCLQKISGIDEYYILYDCRTNKEVENDYSQLQIDKVTGLRILKGNEKSLQIHTLKPSLERKIRTKSSNFIESLWKSGEHTARKSEPNHDNWRFTGKRNFSRMKIKNFIDAGNGSGWTKKHNFKSAAYYKIDKKYFFLELEEINLSSLYGEKSWNIYLGCLDFNQKQIESKILIGTESSIQDKKRIPWINRIGITNGTSPSKILHMPWLMYNDYPDSSYLIRELFRAFMVAKDKTDSGTIAGKNLPKELFDSEYAYGEDLYKILDRLGIIGNFSLDDFIQINNREILSRFWWRL